jgi:outer membrane protein assembly factor BamB
MNMRLNLLGVTLGLATMISLAGCAPPPPPGGQPGSGGAAESSVTDVPPVTDEVPDATAKPPTDEEQKAADMPAGAETATEQEPAGTESATKPESTETEAETKPQAEPEKAETPAEPAKEQSPEPAQKTDSAAESEQTPASAAAAPSGDRVVTGDWPMWGGTIHRNMVNASTGISIDFKPAEDPKEGQKILWVSQLGSQTYGNPVVAQGKVFVGTNNGGNHRPQHKGDRGCVLCFDAKTGEFLWQLTREKLPQGCVNDWPEQGICSTVAVDGERMYVVTNRCELMCVDTNGFYDGENDGPYQDEADKEKQDADIVWNLDMIETLGVFPHNLAASSPVVYGDMVYVHTGNGVDESHLEIPAPRAPSFIAANKRTGEVVWENNDPFDKVLHGQWSSPSIGLVNGQAQAYFAGGNGWLYAFHAKTGEELWRFDLNPKDAKYELGGRGTRNYVIATPAFVENSVLLATGQDPEHGDGVGHLWRIDATKRGDVSAVTPENQPNPNSAAIWHLGGIDADGSVTGKKGEEIFRRTLSTVSVHDGLVYIADLSGRIHCVDFATGKRYWEADVLAAIWGSTMVADGKVFIGDEDGIVTVFAEGKELKKLKEFEFPSSIYSTPTIANGVIFVSDRSRLYAIATQ